MLHVLKAHLKHERSPVDGFTQSVLLSQITQRLISAAPINASTSQTRKGTCRWLYVSFPCLHRPHGDSSELLQLMQAHFKDTEKLPAFLRPLTRSVAASHWCTARPTLNCSTHCDQDQTTDTPLRSCQAVCTRSQRHRITFSCSTHCDQDQTPDTPQSFCREVCTRSQGHRLTFNCSTHCNRIPNTRDLSAFLSSGLHSIPRTSADFSSAAINSAVPFFVRASHTCTEVRRESASV